MLGTSQLNRRLNHLGSELHPYGVAPTERPKADMVIFTQFKELCSLAFKVFELVLVFGEVGSSQEIPLVE